MRKNINKLVAFAIGISVMSGNVIPAFAADAAQTTNTAAKQNTNNAIYVQDQVKQKPVLTLKQAIDVAISSSETLQLKAKKIKLEEDKLDLQENIDDDGYDYDAQKLAVKQAKEDKEFQEDQLAQTIVDKYTDLVAKQDELIKLKKQIDVKSKQFSDSQLKVKLGMMTSVDLQSAQNDLQTQKNTEKLKEDQLENSRDYFQVLTGKNLSQYSLEQDQEYETFKIDGSVDDYFDSVIDKYLRYDAKSNELLKDHVKDLKTDKPDKAKEKSDFDDTVDPDGNVLESGDKKYQDYMTAYNKDVGEYKTYLQTKYSYNASKVGLDEQKKNYKKALKDSYANLLDLENQINVMKSKVEVNNKQLSIAKLKLDTGLMTKADYDTQVLANMDFDTNLRALITNYNSLKNKIQKPWVLVGSSGSGSAAGASAGAGA